MPAFASLPPASMDPILRAFQGFAADRRPDKVNLSVGMSYNADGAIPLMDAVARAQRSIVDARKPWGYLMPEGLPGLRDCAMRLAFGAELAREFDGRTACMQAIGGTGALRLAAELLQRTKPGATVALSRPAWPNYAAIFQAAGLPLAGYDYFDPATGGVDVGALLASLAELTPGSIVVIQGCCHNPTGSDIPASDWERVCSLLLEREFLVVLDVAYAGFGDGLEADLFPVRLLTERKVPTLVAMSFSKNFALYGERVGLLAVPTASAAEAGLVLDTLKNISRSIYSTPPTHGAQTIATILSSPELEAAWRDELGNICARLRSTRQTLLDRLAGNRDRQDLGFLVKQKGLFSYTGLGAGQITRMRDEFGVHAVEDGRICVAAVNESNIDRVSAALREVL